jgi:hypothetical protein
MEFPQKKHKNENPSMIPSIKKGKILTYRLYDTAFEIDLSKVEEKLKKETRRFRIKRKPFSKAFEFTNPPVSFQLLTLEKEFTGRRLNISVHVRAYDYGVLSIILEIPVIDMDFLEFEKLAFAIKNSEEIDYECRNQLRQAIEILGDSLIGYNPSLFEEDYTIFFIESLDPETGIDKLFLHYDIAKLLLYEDRPLSEKVRDEITAMKFSYYTDDCTVLSWDSALIIEPSGEPEIADILEFAHAQLLELRYYDNIVDRELVTLYENISAKGTPSLWKIRKYEKLAAKVMRTITELTDITEKIDNSLKVTEDVYYAKIYMAALRLFRVKEWDAVIRRKLDLATRVYDMLYRDIATKRTELLELVIIILIAVEIVLFIFQ